MKRSRSYCRPVILILDILIRKYLGSVSQPLYLTSFFQPLSPNQLYPNLCISRPLFPTNLVQPLWLHSCVPTPVSHLLCPTLHTPFLHSHVQYVVSELKTKYEAFVFCLHTVPFGGDKGRWDKKNIIKVWIRTFNLSQKGTCRRLLINTHAQRRQATCTVPKLIATFHQYVYRGAAYAMSICPGWYR